MAYPNTNYPAAYDVAQVRVDNVDVIWANEYHYHDEAIRTIELFTGIPGKLLGEDLPGSNPGGMLSRSADGSTAFRFACVNDFTSGNIATFEDDFGGTPTILSRINYAGTFVGGVDASAATMKIPVFGTLPAAGTPGLIAFQTGGTPGLYADNGSSWDGPLGAATASVIEYDWASNYEYTQAASPVEETMGYGSALTTDLPTATFRAVWNPQFTSAGSAELRLYDIGSATDPGAPSAPVLKATLSASASGLRSDTQTFTPTAGNRMYEVSVYQSSIQNDTVYVGSAGITGR